MSIRNLYFRWCIVQMLSAANIMQAEEIENLRRRQKILEERLEAFR